MCDRHMIPMRTTGTEAVLELDGQCPNLSFRPKPIPLSAVSWFGCVYVLLF